MRRTQATSKIVPLLLGVFIIAPLLVGVGLFYGKNAHAASLQSRTLMLSSALPDGTARYRISFFIPTAGIIGSIKAEFCDNTALFEVSCNPPPGMDVSSATLVSQTGETGFAVDPLSNANTLILSRAPVASPGGVTVTYDVDGVHNASAVGSQYARFSTYPTNDASGADTDRGSVAYALNPDYIVSAEVPPFIVMCLGITITGTDCNTASGNYVNLGDLSPIHANSGQTQVVIGTNAGNGYSLRINGTTMNSGNNSIPPLAAPTVSAPGISQFGVNLRANTNPVAGQDPSGSGLATPAPNYNQPNYFMYQSGDVLASYSNVDDFRKYTITYLVNIARSQPPGVYSSTFTYTGIGNF
jgi:hypothetical protein